MSVHPPFGRMLTAMVTPFTADGRLDLDATTALADHLIELGNDGLVLNGTTGESATTSDQEKDSIVRAVVDAVGSRAIVIAGVGSNETSHSIELAQAAEKAGAAGALIVTPYYNRPPQAGLLAHFMAVADATGLPVMLYDIPARTGTAIDSPTLMRLAEHPRIVANKDAKGELNASAQVIAESGLAYYSGDDALNLPLLSIGAVGAVSVTGHLVADRLAEMITSFERGDVRRATEVNAQLIAVTHAVMTLTPGAIAVKAALLAQHNLPSDAVRLPLVAMEDEMRLAMLKELGRANVAGFSA